MQKDQAQCMSLKKLKYSAILLSGFFINAHKVRQGKSPKTANKIIPGIKKSLNGDFSKIDKGNPPNNLPDGDIINAPPPPMALIPRNVNKKNSKFLAFIVEN